MVMPGMGFGLDLPCITVTLRGSPLKAAARQSWMQAMGSLHPLLRGLAERPDLARVESLGNDDWPSTVKWLLHSWHGIQDMLGAPASAPGRVLSLTSGRARCVVPVTGSSASAMLGLLIGSVHMLSGLPQGLRQDPQQRATLQKILASLQAMLLAPSNVPMFISAARKMELPMLELPGRIWQFGIGSRARWLDSSYTDATPHVAHNLSKRKDLAAKMLQKAGIPATEHHLVRSADHAVGVAHSFGYPVVVKPVDRDGGDGVFTDLRTPEEVRAAYVAASRFSSNLLVERHVEGRDYRLVVLHGRLIFALERVAAGVIGDGVHSVMALLNQRNAQAIQMQPPRPEIELNQEALRLLERQRLTTASVPAPGQRVRLRSAANHALGGSVVAVTDQVHADNMRLAIRSAEALRLDLAGIDVLMPDITRSWFEVGATICEVNGQPYLGRNSSAHLYAEILTALVPGSGRVPTVVVVGAEAQTVFWMRHIEEALTGYGRVVGMAGPNGVRIGDEQISRDWGGAAHATQVLALDRRVETMVIGLYDTHVLQQGLAFSRFDWLLLVGTPASGDRDAQSAPQLLKQLLDMLLPACDGIVLYGESYTAISGNLKPHTPADVQALPPPGDWLAPALSKLLARHGMDQAEGSRP